MNNYKQIADHYVNCFKQHGDTAKGVDWPNEEDLMKRFQVMLGVIREKDLSGERILDFGCGTAKLFDYINQSDQQVKEYVGLDIAPEFVNYCKNKYPKNKFIQHDVIVQGDLPSNFDYILMNGVFTEKRTMSFNEMWEFFQELITKIFPFADKGIAFNVMSADVDWERDDLFHLPLDKLSQFLCSKLSRHFIIRNDYGLYEYTVYLYKKTIWQK